MTAPDPPPDFEALDLSALDEILQVMYWLRGERLASGLTADELSRWLKHTPDRIQQHLEHLEASGLVASDAARGPPRFYLTESGVREGGRRFADEFSGLTGQAHGECSDLECDCAEQGPASCRHAHSPTEGR